MTRRRQWGSVIAAIMVGGAILALGDYITRSGQRVEHAGNGGWERMKQHSLDGGIGGRSSSGNPVLGGR